LAAISGTKLNLNLFDRHLYMNSFTVQCFMYFCARVVRYTWNNRTFYFTSKNETFFHMHLTIFFKI